MTNRKQDKIVLEEDIKIPETIATYRNNYIDF